MKSSKLKTTTYTICTMYHNNGQTYINVVNNQTWHLQFKTTEVRHSKNVSFLYYLMNYIMRNLIKLLRMLQIKNTSKYWTYDFPLIEVQSNKYIHINKNCFIQREKQFCLQYQMYIQHIEFNWISKMSTSIHHASR